MIWPSLNWLAHFHHHRAGGAAHGFHRHGAEQVGDQAADEQADDHHVVAQVEGHVHAAPSSAWV
jgi:RNA 3'-terminal phosphate cyclase